ncbi:hypothetical protein CBR_g26340 [Chara braunii]|uniref:P-type phospholipid transporter n=1 Tax=Chara braunii TaxID=69332 RepID=A0A388L7K9_CHABU|nr:hypothetical protein CBR_g26340 [Chara braunii]|eukprot:GBG78311.1 hypothetical protein CBR_g26340 [Chara braunii]
MLGDEVNQLRLNTRTVRLHCAEADRREALSEKECPPNIVQTSKYNLLSFLPINLFKQFSRTAKGFSLLVATLQLIPGLSPTSWVTTVMPLSFALLVDVVKEGYSDYMRHKADYEVNNRTVQVLKDKQFVPETWANVIVGDIVRVHDGVALVETSKLDGESNLETKYAFYRLLKKEAIWQWDKDCTSALKKLKRALIEYPVLKVADPSLPFVVTTDASQYGIGAVLQQEDGNGYRPVEFMSARMPCEKVAASTYETKLYALRQALDHWKHYLLGRHFKVYSDHETLRWLKTQAKMTPKLTRWAAEIDQFDFELKPVKGKYNVVADALSRRSDYFGAVVSKLERRMNRLITVMILCVLAFSLACAVEYNSWMTDNDRPHMIVKEDWPYLGAGHLASSVQFIRFIILFSSMVPASLYVMLDLAKVFQSLLIEWDIQMYHQGSNTCAKTNTFDLNEELGQVEIIFSDKTGTLTQNVMAFIQCDIGGITYGKRGHSKAAHSKATVSSARYTAPKSLSMVRPAARRARMRASQSVSSKHRPAEKSSQPLFEAKRSVRVQDNKPKGGVSKSKIVPSLPSFESMAMLGGLTKKKQTAVQKGFLSRFSLYGPRSAYHAAGKSITRVIGLIRRSIHSTSATPLQPRRKPVIHTISLDPVLRRMLRGLALGDEIQGELCKRFFMHLATCHTVIPTYPNGSDTATEPTYQSASPDEEALVAGAAGCGYKLIQRHLDEIVIDVQVAGEGITCRDEGDLAEVLVTLCNF